MIVNEPAFHTDEHAPELASVDVLTVLQALSDPVRLEIVRQLASCSAPDGLMCGQLDLPVSKSTGSHHLKTLHHAGVTAERQQGVCKYIRLRRLELDERFPGLIDSVLYAAESERRDAPVSVAGPGSRSAADIDLG
jgi:DNA-binding transcriptional ArsR family regulator